jgi:hypothetical protein
MQRRSAVKYLFVIAAGSAILPSCLHKAEKPSIALRHLHITQEQEKTLREIAGTIIPSGTAPGAKDTYAHLFVLRMVDDCYDAQRQQSFLTGLRQVDKLARHGYGSSFTKCDDSQRNQIMKQLEEKNAPKEAIEFYKMMKELTIKGYLTSKPVLGEIFRYELVPGRYNGFFPVTKISQPA